MPYGLKVTYDGTDISDKVGVFSIIDDVEAFCRELSIEITDQTLFDQLDFSKVVIDLQPRIEVFTKTDSIWHSQGRFFIERPTYSVGMESVKYGVWGRSETAKLAEPFASRINKTWESEIFFNDLVQEVFETGVIVSGEYVYTSGEFSNELTDSYADFVIQANTYTAENIYPIDVVKELIEFAKSEMAFVCTGREGTLKIKDRNMYPTSSSFDITDSVLTEISEEPQWPEYGDRIQVVATEQYSTYGVKLELDNECFFSDASMLSRIKAIAFISDASGNPLDGQVVNWNITPSDGTVGFIGSGELNTKTGRELFIEYVRASSKNTVETTYPPLVMFENHDDPLPMVHGIYAYNDKTKSYNYAYAGYTYKDGKIHIVNNFNYCNQFLRVEYECSGVAKNTIGIGGVDDPETTDLDTVFVEKPARLWPNDGWTVPVVEGYSHFCLLTFSGEYADYVQYCSPVDDNWSKKPYSYNTYLDATNSALYVDVSGELVVSTDQHDVTNSVYVGYYYSGRSLVESSEYTVTATIYGNYDEQMFYKDNYCKCKDSITVTKDPDSLTPGETSTITVHLENSGVGINGREISFEELTNYGTVNPTTVTTSTQSTSELATVFNDIDGVSRITLSKKPLAVEAMHETTKNTETGDTEPTSVSVTGSISEDDFNSIDLNEEYPTGTQIYVRYSCDGVAVTYFTAGA